MNHRSLIWRFVALSFGILCADHAIAQDRGVAGQGRIYVGGAVGQGGYDADFERTKAVIRGTGATAFSVSANKTDTMWKGYLGYRFNPYVSVEAGYWDFGKVDLSATISAPTATSMQRSISASGMGASAVFWVPVSNSWSGLVKAGAMRTETKASAGDVGGGLTGVPAESSTKLNSHWGVGVEYRLTPAAAARIEYENVRKVGDDTKFGTADIIMWTVGASYRF